MAPTIIVGDDENAGDVAARLLELADHQRDVKTRTDMSKLAFDVPDDVYDKYIGRQDRPDDERRENSVQRAAAKRAAADDTVVRSDDELPDSAKVAEPGTGDDLDGPIVGDELPDSAKVVDPPANGEFPNGDPTEADTDRDETDTEKPEDKPKARKRAPRKAAKSAPAAAGTDK